MKISHIILVSAFIGVACAKVLSMKSPQKYVKCSKKNQILWPDYSDKRSYFECIGEETFVKRSCPIKTVFNYHMQQCSWPEEWLEPPELNNLVEPVELIPAGDYAPSCKMSELHLLWPHPEITQDYFRCTGIGKYERISCPPQHVLAFLVQMCVKEDEKTTTVNPIERFPYCTINELHITWPDPWYPQNYFVCTGIGQSELRECPHGAVFVFKQQMCVSDGGLTTPESPTYITTTSSHESEITEKPASTGTKITRTASLITTTETRQTPPTAPTATPNAYKYPKLKCIICWRPTCDANELNTKYTDFDSPHRYFECLREGVFTLRTCRVNSTFDFIAQKCQTQAENVKK